MHTSHVAPVCLRRAAVITSKERFKDIVNDQGHRVHVRALFWNPTVANLTLMV